MSVSENWNPRWNYHLGGEPRSICACPDGPYEGARPAAWPRWCERCGCVPTSELTPDAQTRETERKSA